MPIAKEEAEPTWIRVAHAVLLHGQVLYGRPQKEFWPFVTYDDGWGLDPKTCERNVNKLALPNTPYFAKDPFRFGPALGLVIGVSIGTESLRGALIDANGWMLPAPGNDGQDIFAGDDDIWHVAELPPLAGQTELPPDEMVERVARIAWTIADRALSDDRLLVGGKLPLLGVAVAWPTPLDRATKMPTSPALAHPRWREEGSPSVTKRVADRLGLATHRSHAINDANAVALAAAFDEIRDLADAGDGRFGRTILALRVGGGLGAGTCVLGSPDPGKAARSAFLETRLIEGASGAAGELGHMPIEQFIIDDVQYPGTTGLEPMPDLTCPCGHKGARCLQTYASATAFDARMRASGILPKGLLEGDERHITSVMLHAMSNVRDERGLRAQEDIGRLIGRSLAAPILMLNPTSITVAGSMAVPAVIRGIEAERARWSPAGGGELPLRPLRGRSNRYSAARGAAIAALRGRLYRRFMRSDFLQTLTDKVGRDDVAPWATDVGYRLF